MTKPAGRNSYSVKKAPTHLTLTGGKSPFLRWGEVFRIKNCQNNSRRGPWVPHGDADRTDGIDHLHTQDTPSLTARREITKAKSCPGH